MDPRQSEDQSPRFLNYASISPPCINLLYLLLRFFPSSNHCDERRRRRGLQSFFFFFFSEILQRLVLQVAGIAKEAVNLEIRMYLYDTFVQDILVHRYLTKWRFSLFHNTYLLSLLASALLGSIVPTLWIWRAGCGLRDFAGFIATRILNTKSWMIGGLWVMWRWILGHLYNRQYLLIFHVLYIRMLYPTCFV